MTNKKKKGFRRTKSKEPARKSPQGNSSHSAVRMQYSEDQMLGAIASVKNGMSRTAAAEQHGVPLSTLKDR